MTAQDTNRDDRIELLEQRVSELDTALSKSIENSTTLANILAAAGERVAALDTPDGPLNQTIAGININLGTIHAVIDRILDELNLSIVVTGEPTQHTIQLVPREGGQ